MTKKILTEKQRQQEQEFMQRMGCGPDGPVATGDLTDALDEIVRELGRPAIDWEALQSGRKNERK